MPGQSLKNLSIVGLFCGLLVSVTEGQVAGTRLFVGVLQETGALVPFARYDGTRWANSWPAPVDGDETKPPSITQVPPQWIGGGSLPPSWRVWLPGGTAHGIRILGPVYSQTNCAAIWTLMTDFPKALNADSGRCPTRTVGIALSTDQSLREMAPTDYGLPIAVMETAFRQLESRVLSSAAQDFRGGTNPPVKVERAWQATLDSGSTVYYVEASRRYPARPVDAGCDRISVFQGWVVKDGNLGKVTDGRVTITDCDFKEAVFVTPMGLIELKGATFVILQSNVWEGQSYGILRIDSGEATHVLDTPVR